MHRYIVIHVAGGVARVMAYDVLHRRRDSDSVLDPLEQAVSVLVSARRARG